MRTPRLEGLTDWRALARGGFAVVWEARQESLDRLVAVKIITRKLDNPEERARFLRESGAAGRMSSHPGIVTVHDAGLLDDDRPYLVMELCTGGSLTRLLKPENRPTQEWVRDLGVRIADALDAAHAQGVLHRDVKPANVLIDAYGHAGLADFGLAVMTDPGMDLEERLEALTPAYAPPEAFAPHSPTKSGDVYSLAATLYALLCGHAPRAVDPDQADPDMTAAQVVMAHLDDPVERLPDVDPRFMDVLMEALDDEPTRRPSAAGFRDALAALELGAPTPALGPELDQPLRAVPAGAGATEAAPVAETPPAEEGDARRRRRRGVLLAAAALVVLLVVTAVALTGRGAPVAAEPGAVTTAGAPSAPDASPSPSPTPTLLAGFTDCSETVGRSAQCGPVPPECFGGVASTFDSLYVASPARCDRTHVYQTFAAAELTTPVVRQSQLDDDPAAKAVCRRALVNDMLPAGERRSDWEVYALPPQTPAEGTLFRCVFGRGERSAPLELTRPG
ncbi:Protein kinase domain-containing protein [Microlunatus sagamiharensis]|uniref:non-specific serine/threonine protein kinase n=1 Tax=Microlunatus sagamiharensis TaxID=546874 RepID=A0A1H2NAK0_9ACTN|nr:Protein kinase domain-containing protein [Microlunatus sagamiharensis]